MVVHGACDGEFGLAVEHVQPVPRVFVEVVVEGRVHRRLALENGKVAVALLAKQLLSSLRAGQLKRNLVYEGLLLFSEISSTCLRAEAMLCHREVPVRRLAGLHSFCWAPIGLSAEWRRPFILEGVTTHRVWVLELLQVM